MDFEFNIEGALKSKANSRQLVKRGGRTISIKSGGALDYEKFAVLQLQQQAKKQKIKPIAETVGLELEIFYPSRRNDLSPELFFDCLQKAGILVNDRQIIEYRCAKHVDKIKPRVECLIYEIGEEI